MAERGTPSAALRRVVLRGAKEFNAGRYFEAHEVFEDALDDIPDDLWELFTGLIQIAVGYHKLTQQLRSASERMLASGLKKIEPYADDAAGLNLVALRRRVRDDLAALRRATLDISRVPPRLQPLR